MKTFSELSKKKPFFIAEMSANHNGSLKLAKKIIFSAKKYGADAIKLQSYTPETMTLPSKKKDFRIRSGLWKGQSLWNLYYKAQTPFYWHKELFDYAKKLKIICFSTPFDETAVDLLEGLNCPFYKVASFEMTDIPLIKKIAKTGKPMIISTGMANLDEIDLTYKVARENGCKDISLLYCVSNYPSKIEDYNFNNIGILKKKYNCKIGFSDHSTDNKIASAAVLAGAEIIEKHVATEGQKKGFDLAFSLKGSEIKSYIHTINESFKLLGRNYFYRSDNEKKNLKFRRSIYTIKPIERGEKFSKENIKIIRPGYGAEPKYYEYLIGKRSPIFMQEAVPVKKKILKRLKIRIY